MATGDLTGHMPLANLLERLDKLGYTFRTQGVAGDAFVSWREIVADLKHGDMAEMLSWDAVWDSETVTAIVTAPKSALESPGVSVEFHARQTL